jgi:hypothetical protein
VIERCDETVGFVAATSVHNSCNEIVLIVDSFAAT